MNTEKKSTVNIISLIVAVVTLIASVALFFACYTLGILPDKYLLIIGGILIAINLFFGFIGFSRKTNKLNKMIQSVICGILSVLMIAGSIMIPSYKGRIEKIITPLPETTELYMNVYVLDDNKEIEEVRNLAGITLGTQTAVDTENQAVAVEDINKVIIEPVVTKEYPDIYAAVDALYAREVDAIILNAVYTEIIAENDDYKDFNEKVRMVYQVTQEIVDMNNRPNTYTGDVTKSPFIVAINGNDTWEYANLKPNAASRTDVNMLVAVNPNTRQVLMVTIPRDSYFAIGGDPNKLDKLTHSSIYGIGVWESTLENAFQCDVDFFVRVNFSSLVNIVDSLGGLDIYNPYAFNTIKHKVWEDGSYVPRSYSFKKGDIHLTGNQTLLYVRERYNLPNGDFGRNEHQALILKALVNKVLSPAIITNFDSLLKAVEGTFTTDFTISQIYSLVKLQLEDMSKGWEIVTYNVTGKTGGAPSYYMPGRNLSMVFPYEEKMQEARDLIQKLLNNEEIGTGK